MKTQLIVCSAIVLALSTGTAFAKKSHGTYVSNNSKNAVAIGGNDAKSDSTAGKGKKKQTELLTGAGGRAIAGSIYLTGGACACDFKKLKNRSRGAVAVGKATAGSIHVSTMARKKGGPRP